MGIIQRQTIKYSAVGFMGVLIGALSTFFVYPKVMDAYGLQQFLLQSAVTFFPFIVLGGHRLSVRYFPEFKDKSKKHHGFLGFLLTLSSIGFGILFLGVTMCWPWIKESWMASEKDPLLINYAVYVVPIATLYAFNVIVQYYLMNFHRVAFPAIFLDFGVKFVTASLWVSYWLEWISLQTALNCLVAYYVFVLCIFLFYTHRMGELFLRFSWKDYLPKFKEGMAWYMAFGALGGLGFQFATNAGTIFMVGSMTTMEKTGIFSIAAFLATVMDIPVKGLIGASVAKIAEFWKENDMSEMQRLYERISSNLMVPGLFVFLAIWVSIDSVFEFLPNTDVLKQGKYVFFFLGLGKVADMAAGLNNHIIHYSKYYYWTFLAMVILGTSNVLLNLWLIPAYGIAGAAMATAFCFFIYNMTNILIVKFKVGLWPWTLKTLYTLLVGIVAFAIAYSIPNIEIPILNIILHSGIFAVIYAILAWKIELSEDLNGMAKQFWPFLR